MDSLRKEFNNETFKKEIYKQQGRRCVNCGSEEYIELHHVVPLILGGANRISNIVPLCHKCHMAAHNGRHVKDFSDKSNYGRKSIISKEEAYPYFDMYCNGEIGTMDCVRLCGYSPNIKVSDIPMFKNSYKKEHGIKQMRNLIDFYNSKRYKRLKSGECVGWILYTDGRKENITYKGGNCNAGLSNQIPGSSDSKIP